MNIYAEHQNLSPKENFNHLKNHDIVLNKIKSNSSNNQNESRLSKEIPMKNNILKHEFKTPAIVHSHKLPKAFNNAMNPKFSNEQYENIKLPENNLEKKKLDESDQKKNIFHGKISPTNNKNLRRFENPHELTEKKELSQENAVKISKNPIAPLKQFFKIAKQNETDFIFDNSTVKIIQSQFNKIEMRNQQNEKVQLNEMITLYIANPNNYHNQIKVMFHIPSLKSYVLKEEMVANLENLLPRKKLLANWKNFLNSSEHFLHIYDIFWNYPEGCTSILTEIMRGGSIKDLLEYCGCLNENIIKDLAIFLLKSYKEYYVLTKNTLGTISLSQILLTENGRMKLGPKLSHNFDSTKHHFNHWRSLLTKLRPIKNLNQSNANNLNDLNDGLFEIGLILLYCAIGEMELFDLNGGSGDLKKHFEDKETTFLKSDTNFFLNDRKKELKNEEIEFDPEIIGSSCCFLHLLWDCCEDKKLGDYLKKRHSSNFFRNFSRKTAILMKKIISQRFSKEFVDFLCCCLRFNQKNRPTIDSLLKHEFISFKRKKDDIDINELLKISSKWKINFSNIAIKEKLAHILQSAFFILEEKNMSKKIFFDGKNLEKFSNEIFLSFGINRNTILNIIKNQINEM